VAIVVLVMAKIICLLPRDTSPYQDGAGTTPSVTPPPAQPPSPPQTRGTQSHSAPTPLKLPVTDTGGEEEKELGEVEGGRLIIYHNIGITRTPEHTYTNIRIYLYTGLL